MRAKVLSRSPGATAALHLLAADSAQRLIRRLGGRGYAKSLSALDVLFGTTNHWVGLEVVEGRQLRVPLNQGLWVYYLFGGIPYEPEVWFLLTRALDEYTLFVDCGANIGYWSVFASSRISDRRQVIAVEASPSTFKVLVANSLCNSDAFTCICGATWSASGVSKVLRVPVGHAPSGSLVETFPGPTADEDVITVTIDELVSSAPKVPKIVLKLDVEGAEIEALRGARATLAAECMVVYEDHGSDLECRNSQFVLDELRMKVYYLHPDARAVLIKSLSQIRELKVEPWRGYNFVAVRAGTGMARLMAELAVG